MIVAGLLLAIVVIFPIVIAVIIGKHKTRTEATPPAGNASDDIWRSTEPEVERMAREIDFRR